MASNPKPTALIFGGVNTFSRALAAFLVPLEGEPLVSHLRIVDKFSVSPPTVYVGSEFPEILKKKEVEYQQVNLTVEASVAPCFKPPEGHTAYDYVFDFTGEIRQDRTEMIFVNTTLRIAKFLGEEAARQKCKAYIRVQLPFYETPEKGVHNEKQDIKPTGVIGTWWHETLRTLGAVKDLNLVILRIGFAYGPYTEWGIVTSLLIVAAVYAYLKKPMKTIWSPGKHPMHTVHVDDVAGAAWACAEWMARLGRKEADALAGETLSFNNDKNKVKEIPEMVPHDQAVIAPLFNLVDDSNGTLLSEGQVATSFFGTTFDFFNIVVNTMAKFKLDDVVEEINEHHVGGWTEMVTKSKPPIPNTPLTAYMDTYALSKRVLAYDNGKIKNVVGYKLKQPEFNHAAIKTMVEKWKAEGSWPKLENE